MQDRREANKARPSHLHNQIQGEVGLKHVARQSTVNAFWESEAVRKRHLRVVRQSHLLLLSSPRDGIHSQVVISVNEEVCLYFCTFFCTNLDCYTFNIGTVDVSGDVWRCHRPMNNGLHETTESLVVVRVPAACRGYSSENQPGIIWFGYNSVCLLAFVRATM